MAIVPEILQPILAKFGQAIEAWYSAQLYAKLVASHPRHLLVRLHGLIDLGPLEVACAGYHHDSGPGTKPTHSVKRMVRILLVRYLYRWSLRETERELDSNLLVR